MTSAFFSSRNNSGLHCARRYNNAIGCAKCMISFPGVCSLTCRSIWPYMGVVASKPTCETARSTCVCDHRSLSPESKSQVSRPCVCNDRKHLASPLLLTPESQLRSETIFNRFCLSGASSVDDRFLSTPLDDDDIHARTCMIWQSLSQNGNFHYRMYTEAHGNNMQTIWNSWCMHSKTIHIVDELTVSIVGEAHDYT